MKKLYFFLIICLCFCLCFAAGINAKQENNSTSPEKDIHAIQKKENPSYVRSLSIGAIIFGSLSMIGGIYIMVYNPNKKKTKKKKTNKK